jgi:hypothetical protein
MIGLAFFGHNHAYTANFDHHLGFGMNISVFDGRDHSSQFNRRSKAVIHSSSCLSAYLSANANLNGLLYQFWSRDGSIDERWSGIGSFKFRSFKDFVKVQVTSPAPPAVGLSPISLMIKGFFLAGHCHVQTLRQAGQLAQQIQIHDGLARNCLPILPQHCQLLLDHRQSPSLRRDFVARQPTHSLPIWLHRSRLPAWRPGRPLHTGFCQAQFSYLFFLPGRRTGTGIQALYAGLPLPLSSRSSKLSTARFFDSMASS